MMNPTAIAFDHAGQMYVSSRFDGTVYRVAPNGTMSTYAEGMGVATGMAFDRDENLYVGDRSGTIFKIDRDRQIFVFATLEPSVSAYHLAFGPHGDLFVTGPTTSSFDCVYKIDPQGNLSTFSVAWDVPKGWPSTSTAISTWQLRSPDAGASQDRAGRPSFAGSVG